MSPHSSFVIPPFGFDSSFVIRHSSFLLPFLLLASCFLLLPACGPNYGRINQQLRESNLALEQQAAKQTDQIRNQQATITHLQDQLDQRTPRAVTLSDARLQALFTVDTIEILSQTDLADRPADAKPNAFRVFVRPRMANGDILPATGTLTVEAFDLAAADNAQKIGTWTFTPEQLKDHWYSVLGTNYFAVNCPLPAPAQLPAHREITFKVRFIDALTDRVFTDQKVVTIHRPE